MFRPLAEIHPDYCPSAIIYNWESVRTGLHVVLIREQTPAVGGYFVIPTEINNDSGCPHTLEHLVFMGSSNYPYKGLLDLLGNKQLSCANAWTCQDQTVYTLQTAGWEGFANLLPVYLDHILNARIQDAAFVTEVYHIDGEGREKGVVFSEMQAIENTAGEVICSTERKLLYQQDSGYAANTGGLMSALRKLTVEEIREYHSKMYRPSNLCLVITGDVEPAELLAVLEPFDSKQKSSVIPRPFVDSLIQDSPLKSTKICKAEFPEQDEAYGEVQLSWIGPSALDLVGNTALKVLQSYFTMESVGKLTTKLVDVEDPLASSMFLYKNEYLLTCIHIWLEGVPTEKLETADSFILDGLAECVDNFDLVMVRELTERARDRAVQNVENNPESFAFMAIQDFIYGNRNGSSLRDRLSDISEYDALASWSLAQWQQFIQKYFITNFHSTVLAAPSREKLKQVTEENEARQNYIQKTFDLKKQAEILEEATKTNEAPIPNHLLQEFATPDYSKIKFIKTKSAANSVSTCITPDSDLQLLIDSDTPAGFELPMNFESHPSEFVNVKIFLSSEVATPAYFPLVDVILTEVFSMPMTLEDGTELSHEQVSQSLKRETISNHLGTSDDNQELVMLELQVRRADYSLAVKWVERAIFSVRFDPQRVGIFASKHLSSLTEAKRDGTSILSSSIVEETLTPKSLRRQRDGLVTEGAFANFDPIDLAQKASCLLKQLFTANNMRVLIIGDIPRIAKPVSSWQPLWSRLQSTGPFTRIPASSLFLKPWIGGKAYLTLCPATESSFFSLVGMAPTSYSDDTLPSLYLASAYLQITEGPLWKAVRGAGLAYGASMSTSVATGQQDCHFDRAADAVGSREETKKIVSQLAAGEESIDEELYIGAISSLVNDLAQNLATPSAAATAKYFDDNIKMRGPDYVRKLITMVQGVTRQQFIFALRRYILPLFDPRCSLAFVVGNPSSRADLYSYLEGIGYQVEVKELV